jgi:hypothetical protein
VIGVGEHAGGSYLSCGRYIGVETSSITKVQLSLIFFSLIFFSPTLLLDDSPCIKKMLSGFFLKKLPIFSEKSWTKIFGKSWISIF